MYRKAGSQSVLSGALSGPYTGGSRSLDAALLDASVRERLDRATAGQGSPTPIAYDRPASRGLRRASWGIIVATMLIASLFATGFGNLDSDWATQPWFTLGIYLALGLLFALCLVPLLRRRALYGGGAHGALRPGRYLFPLDVVDIALPDVTGRQTIAVRPIGDARDALIEVNGKQTDLVIVFEGGERARFPLRGDPSGEIALRRLEHAQHLVEELTYKKALEKAFANDVFFDLRVDASWARVAPGTNAAPVRTTNLFSLVLGRFATVLAAVVALGLGGGVFFARRALGDVALYNHAQQYGSVDAIDRYLAHGGRKRVEALDLRRRLVDASERARKSERSAAERESGFAAEGAVQEAAIDERCIKGLEQRASKDHPKTVAFITQMLRGARSARDRGLTISFHDDVSGKRPPDLELEDYEQTFFKAITYALWEVCPASVLHIELGESGPGIVVRNHVTVHPEIWHVRGDAGIAEVHPVTFLLQASFRDGAGRSLEEFTLTLPPAASAPLKTRERSLYDLSEVGPAARLVYAAQTARAYDRLYDEVWSLFFDGDPHLWKRPRQPSRDL